MGITRAKNYRRKVKKRVGQLRLLDVLVAAPIAEHGHRNRNENDDERDDDNELNDSKQKTEADDQPLEQSERQNNCCCD